MGRGEAVSHAHHAPCVLDTGENPFAATLELGYLRPMTVASLRGIAPELAPFVSGLQYFEADEPTAPELERILPGGQVHLMVNLHEDEFRIYEGPHCATVLRSGGAVMEGPTSHA